MQFIIYKKLREGGFASVSASIQNMCIITINILYTCTQTNADISSKGIRCECSNTYNIIFIFLIALTTKQQQQNVSCITLERSLILCNIYCGVAIIAVVAFCQIILSPLLLLIFKAKQFLLLLFFQLFFSAAADCVNVYSYMCFEKTPLTNK